jgi:hypothetical protein
MRAEMANVVKLLFGLGLLATAKVATLRSIATGLIPRRLWERQHCEPKD